MQDVPKGNVTSEIAIWSTMRAKPGREADAERFLFETLDHIHRETGTTRFFLLKLANSSFASFDIFVGAKAFQAHLDGPVPKFVAKHAAELFEDPPTIMSTD